MEEMTLVFKPADGTEGELVLKKKFKNRELMYLIIGRFAKIGWTFNRMESKI
jgi:hypothetical protein